MQYPPPVLSPDGRFYWSGISWTPLPLPVAGHLQVAALEQVSQRKGAFGYWLASFIFPGLGTMFAGRVLKGFFLFVAAAAGDVAIWSLANSVMSQTGPADGFSQAILGANARVCTAVGCTAQIEALVAIGVFLLVFGLWIFGMVDAVSSIHKWNRAHGYTR